MLYICGNVGLSLIVDVCLIVFVHALLKISLMSYLVDGMEEKHLYSRPLLGWCLILDFCFVAL